MNRLLVEIWTGLSTSEDIKGSEEHYGENINHFRESLNNHEIPVSSYMDIKGISGEVPEGCEYLMNLDI